MPEIFPLPGGLPAFVVFSAQAATSQKDWMTLQTASEGALAITYLLIGCAIIRFIQERPAAKFVTVYALVGLFVLASAAVHFVDLVAPWYPAPWLASLLNVLAAASGVAAAVAMVRAVPQALNQPSPDLLKRLNDELEQRVGERTQDLTSSNERLASEVKQREEAEAEVRRLNRTLEERLHELQTVLDLLPVGIAIAHDHECRDLRTNRLFAEMLGIPFHASTSLSAVPFPTPPFRAMKNGRELAIAELPMQKAARENVAVSDFEMTFVRDDGRELHVLVNAIPLRDAGGLSRGCVASMQDVTAQKLAAEDSLAFERRLQERQKLESLGVLAGGIAHDFNNLLTGILGNASIARIELPTGHAPVRSALDNLEQAALRAADLCKQMLAYAGKGRFVVQPLSLSGIVGETTELLEVSVHRRARLHFELEEALPAFQGDATQIRQVLMNLVINASEAIGDRNGTITVRTRRVFASQEMLSGMAFRDVSSEGVFVCLEIADTGGGMDPQMIARIFDPFFTTKFTGRGLGLAAVLGIVRGHKGAIDVESVVGKGTTFRIYLPALEQLATPPDAILHRIPEGQRTGTVLVVDDEPAVRGVAVRVLRNAGYRVVEAEDGASAVELVRKGAKDYALVLLDLTMPRMDGEEAFRVMRGIEPDLRVVVMSGFNEQETEDRFGGQGLAGFVAKPFSAETLLSKVNSVLSRPQRS